MTIEYYKTKHYGQSYCYVKDAKLAQILLDLTGKKTLDSHDMAMLTMLGLSFIEVLPL